MKKALSFALITAAVLAAGCVQQQAGTYTIYFFVNETNEPLDGSVLLFKDSLGNTTNGNITVPKASLYPGEITINGSYKGTPFEYTFDLTKEDLQTDGPKGFYITESEAEGLTFSTAGFDTAKMARDFFDKINANRAMRGLNTFAWNDRMAAAASEYAANILRNKGNYEMETNQILINKNIFAIYANNLYYYDPDLGSNEDFSAYTAEFMSSSKSYSDIALSKDYDTAGAGFSCEGKGCAMAFLIAKEAYSDSFSIDRNMCSFRELFWKSMPLDKASAQIRVNASVPVDIYILRSSEDFGSTCVPKNPVVKVQLQKTYEKTMTIERGYGIVFYAPNDVNVTYSLEFTP